MKIRPGLLGVWSLRETEVRDAESVGVLTHWRSAAEGTASCYHSLKLSTFVFVRHKRREEEKESGAGFSLREQFFRVSTDSSDSKTK